MKKKTINQKDFILLSAHSRSNGIVFESKECPFLQVDTFVDTKGNIQSIIVPNEIGAIHELVEFKNTYLKKESNKLFLILTVIFDLAMFIFLTAVFRNLSISYAWIYFCASCSVKCFRLAESYWRYDFKTKKFIANPVLKFHAAEHMAYNFYNTYKRVPTLEEIKKSSRFSEHCGRYRMLSELGFSTVFTLFLMTVTTNFGFIVSLSLLGLMLFLYVILFNSGKLKFLEVLVTRKPTDLELQCAIKGLETLDKLEKSIIEENADVSGEDCFKCLKIEISDPKLYEEYFNSAIDNLFDFCDEVN